MTARERPAIVDGERGLARVIGFWGLAAGIVNVTIGGGVFRLPASVAAVVGAAAPLAYLACTVAIGLIVLCFADAGSRVAMTGGPYAYVETAFGPFVGFVSGVLLWVGVTLAFSAVSSFFADSLLALVPALGVEGRRIVLFVVLAALAAANMRGVAGMTRFNAVATVAKLLPLGVFIVAGLVAGSAAQLRWQGAPERGTVARASFVLLFAFFGMESALVPSGEVRDPARTVPRAVLLALGAVAVLYLLVQLAAQSVLGDALAGDRTPLATAAGRVLGPGGRTMILVGSSISMFAYVSGMTLAVPRMLFAFARDGFLPARLASVHARWRTPYVAIAVQTLLVAGLAAFADFEKLAVAANATALLAYAACCAATAVLQWRDVRGHGEPFHVPGARAVPWLALLVMAWMLGGLERAEWLAAATIIVVAVVLYGATARSRRARVATAA